MRSALILSACVAAVVGWAYVRQPPTLAEVAGGLSASVGAHRIDQQAFDEALLLLGARESRRARSRSPDESAAACDRHLNGFVVLLTAFFASAQAFSMVTPDAGLPRLLCGTFLFVLLLNTIAAATFHVIFLILRYNKVVIASCVRKHP